MIDIIRVKLPGGVKRFPMFTVRDQLSFLLTSADMEGKTLTEQQEMLDEILDIMYPGYSRTEQENIFTKVYCVSFGKNAIKIRIKGSSGQSEAFMHVTDYVLQNEYALDDSLTLGFKFPKHRNNSEQLFLECIQYVKQDGERYEWNALDEDTKNAILDLVSIEDMENIVKLLRKSCHVTVRDIEFSDLLTLYKILFNKSELNEFFKTNYLLNKNTVQIEPIMNGSPMERSIYVALLAEDLKRKENANA
ncbi:MAG: baseplate [Enterobacter phage ENC19]|nr:MAG: baseplate [Enterobacter phage ENC19]